jgi:TrmH family RNA methyltransferase
VFVIEGATLVAEALEAGFRLEGIYVESSAIDRWRSAQGSDLPAGLEVVEVVDGVMGRIASTVSPQPVMAVAALPSTSLADLVNPSFVVVCEQVADPGNAGTIIRSAEASGADAVLFTPGSVDPYNPKCVRASAGALFHVPVVVDADPALLGLPLVGAVAAGGAAHTAFDFRRPVALVLGNEAHGISPTVHLDALVSIEHVGRSESLNVAMAATVLCFEIARQRHG